MNINILGNNPIFSNTESDTNISRRILVISLIVPYNLPK
ncbi:hypothetical protein HMPREF9435_0033 [Gardnerella vaginalis 315-A]|nr:hypothetical protein HMPREF9435_0033 [Gardnerella vaginalis 315-A]